MPTKRPRRRFQDILDEVSKIRRHTAGMDFEAYATNELVIDATERCLSRISEAAVKLGPQAEQFAPAIPWNDVRGLGNILRHGYDGVSIETIWKIVTVDLAEIEGACEAALQTLPADPD